MQRTSQTRENVRSALSMGSAVPEGMGMLHGSLCPHCKRIIPARRVRGVRHWENATEYMRDLRRARKADGLCTRCGRRRAAPGMARCRACNGATAGAKRKLRQIGGQTCDCGRPAVNVVAGEYICAECYRIECGHVNFRRPNAGAEARRERTP